MEIFGIFILKSFIDVHGPSYVCKTVEIHHQKKNSVTSLIFILMLSKHWISL